MLFEEFKCVDCGAEIDHKSSARCPSCHKKAKEALQARLDQSFCGGQSCSPEYELRSLAGGSRSPGVNLPIALRSDVRQRRYKHE